MQRMEATSLASVLPRSLIPSSKSYPYDRKPPNVPISWYHPTGTQGFHTGAWRGHSSMHKTDCEQFSTFMKLVLLKVLFSGLSHFVGYQWLFPLDLPKRVHQTCVFFPLLFISQPCFLLSSIEMLHRLKNVRSHSWSAVSFNIKNGS